MQAKVFLDTAYAIALTIKSDTFHKRAIRLADILARQKTRLVTTRPILLEIGNALSQLRYRHVAVSLLRSLELDPLVEIVPLSEPLYQRAFQLYCDRADKT